MYRGGPFLTMIIGFSRTVHFLVCSTAHLHPRPCTVRCSERPFPHWTVRFYQDPRPETHGPESDMGATLCIYRPEDSLIGQDTEAHVIWFISYGAFDLTGDQN